jgi:hypothetical protein
MRAPRVDRPIEGPQHRSVAFAHPRAKLCDASVGRIRTCLLIDRRDDREGTIDSTSRRAELAAWRRRIRYRPNAAYDRSLHSRNGENRRSDALDPHERRPPDNRRLFAHRRDA